jgi:carboxypeptidase Q
MSAVSSLTLLHSVATGLAQSEPADITETYRPISEKIIKAATDSDYAYQRLAVLVDTFGPRLSGSENLENAIDWVLEELKSDGLEEVHGEPVMVPHWVRNEESLSMTYPRPHQMAMLGLGGTIGTPEEGIEAEVLVVNDFIELRKRSKEAEGKIVLFNTPFTEYGRTVMVRVMGGIEAARSGAVASLIRSVGPFSMQTPHTGGMSYQEGVRKIPHAAITIEDAEMLSRMQQRGITPKLKLFMGAQTHPDAPSRNVIAEIKGCSKPEEVVVLGGHIDSWDVGQGAMDDGGGCMAAWEALRTLKRLGIRPRRTIRLVLWTNEENGLKGALAYRDQHAEELDKHVLAMESDSGVFSPLGFGFAGPEKAAKYALAASELLEPIGSNRIRFQAGGADVMPLHGRGVPIMDLQVDGERYFWYHHTNADTLDKLKPEELAKCAATMAVMAYVIADMPESLNQQ